MTPEDLMRRGIEIMERKAHDYTGQDASRWENFERSAVIVGWFKHDIDRVFATLITTKLARLATLLDTKEPKNESVEDSFVDLMNYCALWGSKRMIMAASEQSHSMLLQSTPYQPLRVNPDIVQRWNFAIAMFILTGAKLELEDLPLPTLQSTLEALRSENCLDRQQRSRLEVLQAEVDRRQGVQRTGF